MNIKRMKSFLIPLIFASVLFAGCLKPELSKDSINPVIGNASWVAAYGTSPDGSEDNTLRIRTHLSYVENLLRQRDVSALSPEKRERRMQLLDALRVYWQRGQFPLNTQYEAERRPCFIDDEGTICAVGYLVEQTMGLEFAENINRQFQYAYISEMNLPELDQWIQESGFTADEIAMIQPTYPHSLPTRKYLIGGLGMSARAIKPGFPSAVLGYESIREGYGSILMRYESLGPQDYHVGLRMGTGLHVNQLSSLGVGFGPSYFQDNGRTGMNMKMDLLLTVFYPTRERRFIPELMLSYGYDFALTNKEAFPISRRDFACHLVFKWNYKTKGSNWG